MAEEEEEKKEEPPDQPEEEAKDTITEAMRLHEDFNKIYKRYYIKESNA